MRCYAVCFALLSALVAAQATWVIEPVTLTLTAGTVSTLLGLKALLIGGLLVKRLARGKRSTNEIEDTSASEVFLVASKKDSDDCAKMLICQLNATPIHKLKEDELVIARTFGRVPAIDVTLTSVEFDVAAHLGRLAGAKQCETMYSRCQATQGDMMHAIRKAAAEYYN